MKINVICTVCTTIIYVNITEYIYISIYIYRAAPYRSVFMLTRAPLFTEGHVTGVYKWRENLIYIVERVDRMVSLM